MNIAAAENDNSEYIGKAWDFLLLAAKKSFEKASMPDDVKLIKARKIAEFQFVKFLKTIDGDFGYE